MCLLIVSVTGSLSSPSFPHSFVGGTRSFILLLCHNFVLIGCYLSGVKLILILKKVLLEVKHELFLRIKSFIFSLDKRITFG